MWKIFTLICLTCCNISWAQDAVRAACEGSNAATSEMRLDALGKCMEGLPVLNQAVGGGGNESGGLCASYVASQMIDAWQQKNGTRQAGRISSPFHIAFNNAVDRGNTRVGGGDACPAIASAIASGGTCDHEGRFLATDLNSNLNFMSTLEETWRRQQAMVDRAPDMLPEYDTPEIRSRDIERAARYSACSLATPNIFGPAHADVFRTSLAILRRLLQDNQYFATSEADASARSRSKLRFMRDYANAMCRPSESPIRPNLLPTTPSTIGCRSSNYLENREEAFKLDLLNKLTSTELPVAIGFCSSLLQDVRRVSSPTPGGQRVLRYVSDPANPSGEKIPECQAPTSRDTNGNLVYTYARNYHISMIMGKRWRAGKCQVLLRNTWGADACTAYAAAGLNDCSGGLLWIDLDELGKNSFAIRNIQ